MCRFVADPVEARVSVPLENLSAMFHAPSGTTHLLVSPAPEILDALAAGPADVDELLKRLREAYDLDPTGAREAIEARLAELEAGGLVRRA